MVKKGGIRTYFLGVLFFCGIILLEGAEDASKSGDNPEPTILLEAEVEEGSTAADLRPDFTDAARKNEREEMVSKQIDRRGVKDKKVLAAMRSVPRHVFVPESVNSHAYDDRPLPIGHGQTISQPYIVALMTEILDLDPESKVLEVGTGSGYQASILGYLVREVVTIEIIDALARDAVDDLKEAEYRNVTVLSGDGYFGYEKEGPYDAIIVTAAAEHIPPPLLEQLKPGGRMIIPVGRSGWTQNLMLVKKDDAGKTSTENILPVRFVPLTRDPK